ncbi:CorA family divalent cation transporter [Sulfurimonas sp. SWIR-19]|uniref:CorA family divalent cation transporter n=1 Tax=Sulfurimonas sp. SWIR-19 TaxID=2878390 RepID=UPI001CF1F073|nr:CorA family divalent cation transporter [Sulfurimonas sp. SWIR-19]UCN01250.1 CorA family divalent cation transporter [Sulfurimonas sp. SWIR-19]
MQKKIISSHTFLLPFSFQGSIEKELKQNGWQKKDLKFESVVDYNEYVYFYKHVQDALYNNDEISKTYVYKFSKGTFSIETSKGNYTLELENLTIRIFQNNIAILVFSLENYKYDKIEDILVINEFGRRIYPQFLGNNFIEDTQKKILAKKITLKLDDKEYSEDFGRFNDLGYLNRLKDSKENLLFPEYIKKVLGTKSPLSLVLDDRMFVISLFLNDDFAKQVQSETYDNDTWYKYVFVDGDDKTCQNPPLCSKMLEEATYSRWLNYGTLFGVTRYSFVALSNGDYGRDLLLKHMKTIYLQMLMLLLAYRTMIVKFSDDIQDVTSAKEADIVNRTTQLYKRYIQFLNKLYFREVTAQDQGIELFNQAKQIMQIDMQLKDLDHEINELQAYTKMLTAEKENEHMRKLTQLGAVFLPGSFIAGFLGMNTIPANVTGWFWTIVVGVSIVFATRYVLKKVNIKYKELF